MLLYEGNDLGDEESCVLEFNLGIVNGPGLQHVEGVLEGCRAQNDSRFIGVRGLIAVAVPYRAVRKGRLRSRSALCSQFFLFIRAFNPGLLTVDSEERTDSTGHQVSGRPAPVELMATFKPKRPVGRPPRGSHAACTARPCLTFRHRTRAQVYWL